MMIPTAGLTQGAAVFEWRIGKEFFASFGNMEILGADLSVRASVQKDGRDVCVDCDVEGTLTVSCDRCLAPVAMEVSPSFGLRLCCDARAAEDPSDGTSEDGRELVPVSASESEYDLSQAVYDYACLSLPIQCVHKEGECDRETVSRLSGEDSVKAGPSAEDSVKEGGENPFSVLKDLF
ncbi:MAG: YceD family protein [Candidatus Cryptobacteroides sp.]